MTQFAKKYFDGASIACAEIGVADARNSVSILEELNVKRMFCIDPYLPYTDKGSIYKMNCSSHNNIQFELAKKNLARFKDKVKFIKKPSEKALGRVTSRLDLLYIDGNHSYEFVKRDIEDYYPKIKKQGIIGGHDFYGTFTGLIIAVIEFAREHNLGIYSDLADWWFVKP